MGKCLLSIDWDYFINTRIEDWGSYIENTKNITNIWIGEANIIYSPYTSEKPEYFKPINNAFNVRYLCIDSLDTGNETFINSLRQKCYIKQGGIYL